MTENVKYLLMKALRRLNGYEGQPIFVLDTREKPKIVLSH
jgi:predicted AAA+ superfamily ATPase